MKTWRDTGRKDGFQWWSSDVSLTGNIDCPEKKELYYQKAVTASVDSVSLSRVLCGCPPHLGTLCPLVFICVELLASHLPVQTQPKTSTRTFSEEFIAKKSYFGTDCCTEAVLGETFSAVQVLQGEESGSQRILGWERLRSWGENTYLHNLTFPP